MTALLYGVLPETIDDNVVLHSAVPASLLQRYRTFQDNTGSF